MISKKGILKMKIMHFLQQKIRKIFLDKEQIALIEKLEKTPGRIKVIGNGTIIVNQEMLLNSDHFKKTSQETSKWFQSLKNK